MDETRRRHTARARLTHATMDTGRVSSRLRDEIYQLIYILLDLT